MTIEARIRGEIEDRIRSGEWRPGHRIPFEHELVARYGCSRATVSKALGSLAKAGLIERRRKAGSFVAHHQVHSAVLDVPDLAHVIAARGEDYRWSLTARRIVEDVPDFSAPALYVQGVHIGGGEPFALETRWINLSAVAAAGAEPFDEIAPGTWLLGHVPWTTARHRIHAIEANRDEARGLGVRHRAACLVVDRTTWRGAEIVTQVRQLFRADRFDMTAEFEPSGR